MLLFVVFSKIFLTYFYGLQWIGVGVSVAISFRACVGSSLNLTKLGVYGVFFFDI